MSTAPGATLGGLAATPPAVRQDHVNSTTPSTPAAASGFRHEALMYKGDDDFLAGTLPFLREGIAADEPILVVVGAGKIARLRSALGADADRVHFEDMVKVGHNPARIIPAWRAFANAHAGRPLRGIGEPIWPGRGAADLVECHRHEALLNVAFKDAPAFWLLCPYDTEGLDPAVVAEAHCTHPHVCEDGLPRASDRYSGIEAVSAPFDAPLPEPAAPVSALAFDIDSLADVRGFVSAHAADAGMTDARAADLMLAVSELAANSVRHGGGTGDARIWRDEDTVLCEVRDGGRIADPLAGRHLPTREQIGGYGLWLANQLCDLVQIRTVATGTIIRLHMRLAGSPAQPHAGALIS
jgi:anti-sigma regulatory factor (Ser/Thr protein kinase)